MSWIASFFLLFNRRRKEEQNFGKIRAHCYFNGEQMVPWVVAKSRNIFQIENKKYINELIANFELKYNEAASWTVAIFLYLNIKGWGTKSFWAIREHYSFDSEWTGLWLAAKIIVTTEYKIKSLKTWKLLYIFKIKKIFPTCHRKGLATKSFSMIREYYKFTNK